MELKNNKAEKHDKNLWNQSLKLKTKFTTNFSIVQEFSFFKMDFYP